MKAKHRFTNLSYAEIDLLIKEFPQLKDFKLRKWGGGGFRWSSIPSENRNKLGRIIRNQFDK